MTNAEALQLAGRLRAAKPENLPALALAAAAALEEIAGERADMVVGFDRKIGAALARENQAKAEARRATEAVESSERQAGDAVARASEAEANRIAQGRQLEVLQQKLQATEKRQEKE